MQFKKTLCWVSLSAAVSVLAACSTTGSSSAPVEGADGASDGVGTKISGVGDSTGFNATSTSKFGGATHGLTSSTTTIGEQTYYFDFDKSIVHEADKPSLQAQADYLVKTSNAKVLLEGHTDPRGSREYNIALGERRGNAVLATLKSDGASADQMRVVSFGAEKPASPGHTEADYALDRRVHLTYVER